MSEQKTGVLEGFKTFLMRGNVVELAVAVVVGAAFTKIVDSVVKGLINPLIGLFGTKNLDLYRWCVKGPCEYSGGEVSKGVAVYWGPILSALLMFVITAAVVYFLMILPMNRYKERQAARLQVDPATPAPTEVELLAEIRDALVAQREGSHDSAATMLATQRGEGDAPAPRRG